MTPRLRRIEELEADPRPRIPGVWTIVGLLASFASLYSIWAVSDATWKLHDKGDGPAWVYAATASLWWIGTGIALWRVLRVNRAGSSSIPWVLVVAAVIVWLLFDMVAIVSVVDWR